jgi:hypothetical protein
MQATQLPLVIDPTAQAAVDGAFNQRRFVEFGEGRLHRLPRARVVDARGFELPENAEATPAVDARGGGGLGARSAAVVERAVGLQALERVLDFDWWTAPAEQPFP